jgi:hypothetical protein
MSGQQDRIDLPVRVGVVILVEDATSAAVHVLPVEEDDHPLARHRRTVAPKRRIAFLM